MGATYHATAIILRREPWRDSARLYTLYTREWGKLLAVGRGTAKSTSKLAAHLEPFTLAEVHLAKGRRLETVCGAVLKRQPEELVADSARHAAASLFAEAVDQLVKWNDRDERLWSLFENFLNELATTDNASASLAGFTWRLLERLGYRPALESCAACRTGLDGGGLFLPLKGVTLCAACRPHERDLAGAQPLRPEALQSIRGGLNDDASTISPATLPAALSFLEVHLDRPLNSLPVVREVLK